MQKIISICVAILLTVCVFGQTPEKMSYQAVIRNSSGQLVTNKSIGTQISILQGSANGSEVYIETQTPTTNANGLISIEIGNGIVISGNFSSIDWTNGPYFIKAETDPEGGTNYTIIGTSQLLSVPFALLAKTAESLTGTITETDPIFGESVAYGISSSDTAYWNDKLDSYTETDPIFGESVAYGISSSDTAYWNGKLDSYTETDPIFGESVAYGISSSDTAYWNGKLDSYTETDPIFGESVAYGISSSDTAYWNGKLDSYTETDPIFGVSVASRITSTDTTFWNNKLDFEVDGSITNELQLLSIISDTIYLTDGGFIKLPTVVSEVEILEDSIYISYTNGQTINAGYVGNGSPGSSLASVTTLNITDINYTQASVNSSITNNGNEFILTRGVCLSKNPSPDLNDTIYYSGNGSGSFATEINLLEPNTTYFLRAFSTNVVGTTYGNELSFTTKALTVPTITTQTISNITDKTAISGGEITDDGGTPILERGLCWSENQNPTISDNFLAEGEGSGSYIALVTGLTANTTYYVRAYATNTQGTAYGDEQSFATIELLLATVSTSSASNVSYTTAYNRWKRFKR